MAILTCTHHPRLRWYCKDIACNADGSYNGARNIFFFGFRAPEDSALNWTHYDKTTGETAEECACPPSDLRFAPEYVPGE